ncbi:glycoside hydrolase family 18 protein [Laccaria bicolor S238N-H82]|uniref:chitinase n=1 Tax=Laccaria bicolor (strain S238N-H82 / ATCC MYA-4686) TaxID=486041 RepID=B0DHY7_LACBS|nr:glycoside hydrolase family 18 protein [Laccaria bicolor S238N-H82]EDR05811.1 glycoside hydrolase family 18 protein [Laccaria bicolor S238N-H82]|eukprot:XP_001883487.1 glycoside hydrolase family 18 protein [Laccaria bicolor S238N-H82]
MPPSTVPPALNRVVAYYQTQYNNNKYCSPTPLTPVVTHLIIAAFHLFADKDGTMLIHLNDVSPEDSSFTQMWTDVAQMQKSGVKVMGMLGGAGTGSYESLSKDFADYYHLLSTCITNHGLDGFDLDIEETDSLDNVVKLIQQLRSDFGEDFIITLAPVASALKGGEDPFSGINYSDLEKNYGDAIDWYNAQFYSGYGSMKDTTDYDAIVTGCPLDPSRLVAIILTNKDNGTGWVELDTVKSTVRKLLQQYSGRKYAGRFGGIAGWEYFNSEPDLNEPWTWATVMKVAMVNWKEVLALKSPDATSESSTTQRVTDVSDVQSHFN